MRNYHINESNDIVGVSTSSQKTMQSGSFIVQSEQEYWPPQDYYYANGQFHLRDEVPYSLPKSSIDVGETVAIQIEVGATVKIQGPGFGFSGVSDGNASFSSDRMGVFKFDLILHPYRKTSFQIEVV